MMLRLTLATFVLMAAACSEGTGPDDDPHIETFSFEEGLASWSPDVTDLQVGDEPSDWSITTTSDSATDGERSVQFVLENPSDEGKIWIERGFQLEPETSYDVRIELDLGTSDFGAVNMWRVIAGVGSRSPETGQDLELAFRDETGHGGDQDVGLVWLAKSYDAAATTGSDGVLHVALGVWGTYEITRTYLMDAVRITFTRSTGSPD
jgi:hypothetical protein